MLTQNLGYLRIGGQRKPKKASENYWAVKLVQDEFKDAAHKIRKAYRQTQLAAIHQVSKVPTTI